MHQGDLESLVEMFVLSQSRQNTWNQQYVYIYFKAAAF